MDASPASPAPSRPIHVGMPPLDMTGKPVSFFEFWPQKIFYLPIALQWAWLALRYRGTGLALNANPLFPDGGMVGESKIEIFNQTHGLAREKIAPYTSLRRSEGGDATARTDLATALAALESAKLQLPVVAKPDVGCRGVGVRPIRTEAQLADYIAGFPAGETIVLQKLVDHDAEAGIFYVRLPGEAQGRIFSLTLKYFPHVIGDGHSTLRQLIEADPRAGLLSHLYLPRHAERLDTVLPAGEPFRLAFAGSHSRGTIFRDGRKYVTPEMTAAFDAVAKDIPEFYFGRFDVRFESMEKLQRGEGFTIIEINGAGGEATHIWDRNTTLLDAYRTLFRQNAYLFEIGARNRARGFHAPGIWRMVEAWRREKRLYDLYPATQ